MERHGFWLKQEKCQFLMSSVVPVEFTPCTTRLMQLSNATPLTSGIGKLLQQVCPEPPHTVASLQPPSESRCEVEMDTKWCPSLYAEASAAMLRDNCGSQMPIQSWHDLRPGAVFSHTFPDGPEWPVTFPIVVDTLGVARSHHHL